MAHYSKELKNICLIDSRSEKHLSLIKSMMVLTGEANELQMRFGIIRFLLLMFANLSVFFQVFERVKELEDDGARVVRFSITGYSLGGLLARYVIGYVFSAMLTIHSTQSFHINFRILYKRKFFANITPINFTTFATPHIGLLRTSSIWSTVTSTLGPKLLSRTGEQFYAVDKWGASGRALLEVMADPSK